MSDKSQILCKTPVRIDLAGGTVDLWPLYLLLQHPITINLGIDLFAEAKLIHDTQSSKSRVTLISEDQNVQTHLDWKDLESFSPPPALQLHTRLLRYFFTRSLNGPGAMSHSVSSGSEKMKGELIISSRARSPAGAGLGGSSALSIALCGALWVWNQENMNPSISPADRVRIIEIVRDIESQVLRGPAGLQDYYGAAFGGLQSIHWGIGGHCSEPLDKQVMIGIEKRVLLFYSGKSRNSGINNWAVYKDMIDQKNGIPEKFERISKATHDLGLALRSQDWKKVGEAIFNEWEARRTLSPGISTPEMDRAFQAARKVDPTAAFKVCGAGGGGCFFVYLSSDDVKLRSQVIEACTDDTVHNLPYTSVSEGMEIQISNG